MTVVASNLCQRKCALTIAAAAVAESATYAVLFSGSGDATKFGTGLPDELFTLAQADGGDICFTSDAAGLNPLPVEIVSILAGSKQAEIWVAVPLTAATATTIYVWYQSTGSTLASRRPRPLTAARPCGTALTAWATWSPSTTSARLRRGPGRIRPATTFPSYPAARPGRRRPDGRQLQCHRRAHGLPSG